MTAPGKARRWSRHAARRCRADGDRLDARIRELDARILDRSARIAAREVEVRRRRASCARRRLDYYCRLAVINDAYEIGLRVERYLKMPPGSFAEGYVDRKLAEHEAARAERGF